MMSSVSHWVNGFNWVFLFWFDKSFSRTEDKVNFIVISFCEPLIFLRLLKFFKDRIVFLFIVDLLMLGYRMLVFSCFIFCQRWILCFHVFGTLLVRVGFSVRFSITFHTLFRVMLSVIPFYETFIVQSMDRIVIWNSWSVFLKSFSRRVNCSFNWS